MSDKFSEFQVKYGEQNQEQTKSYQLKREHHDLYLYMSAKFICMLQRKNISSIITFFLFIKLLNFNQVLATYMNQQKIEHLAERILNETNSAMNCLSLYIGHKLDLFNFLREAGPITSIELADKTNYSKRYLQEWLDCMFVNGYIEYE